MEMQDVHNMGIYIPNHTYPFSGPKRKECLVGNLSDNNLSIDMKLKHGDTKREMNLGSLEMPPGNLSRTETNTYRRATELELAGFQQVRGILITVLIHSHLSLSFSLSHHTSYLSLFSFLFLYSDIYSYISHSVGLNWDVNILVSLFLLIALPFLEETLSMFIEAFLPSNFLSYSQVY